MVAEKYSSKGSPNHSPSQLRFFWDGRAHSLSPFFDAPSTRYYFECERMLFENYFINIQGKKILKTDLWDEAKNTQILKWASENGAKIYGLDISPSMVNEAQSIFNKHSSRPRFIVNDLRFVAFKDGTFDYLYSMGTIEHFPEYNQALRECFRVLKKGGRAIIGVPNKCDPFFRPLMVSFLYSLDLYAYGYEKSFTMKALEEMVKEVGFRVIDRTGILFMPGIFRMIDLFLYVNLPRTTVITRILTLPFSIFYRKFPSLRRHGYLIACVVEKP